LDVHPGVAWRRLEKQFRWLVQEAGALPDKMPLDEGVKKELPEESIR